MAIAVEEIGDWIASLPRGTAVAIDDGGLILVHLGSRAYLEVGGIPDAESGEECV